MLCSTDDDTATVDNVFKGPSGYTLWWEARFSAYGIGLGLFMVAMLLEYRAGIGLSFWWLVFTLIGVVLVTRKIGKHSNYETPPKQLFKIVYHEVSAPRPRFGRRRSVLVPMWVPVNKPKLRHRVARVIAAMLAPNDGGKK